MARGASSSFGAWTAASYSCDREPSSGVKLARVLCCLCLAGILAGCTRAEYRQNADRESYRLISSRQTNPLWDVPNRPVEPQPISRMYVVRQPDCGPKPADDPAAKQYMDYPDGFNNTRTYSKIPTRAESENPVWLEYLPRGENGNIQFSQALANDLGLIHSREYQTAFESVYLQALQLSSNRFEFDTQWTGGVGGGFTASGADLGSQRELDITLNRLGFTRSLAGGGQFATQLLNGLTWDFGSGGIQNGSAALVTTFTQPLLRGAFRYVRLEELTQSERNLLYAVRDYARFRRLFYVDIASSYLGLLARTQAIRNSQANVQNLRQNLIEYDFYVQLRTATQIQRDQVFQQYQNGRLSLLAVQQDFAAALDDFRFQLGLPSWLPLEMDESLLQQFDLVNPELAELQTAAQDLFVELMQYLPPETGSREQMLGSCQAMREMRDRVATILPDVEGELQAWLDRLDDTDVSALGVDDRLDYDQQLALARRIQAQLIETRKLLDQREQAHAELVGRVDRLYDQQQRAVPQLPDPNPGSVDPLSADGEDPLSGQDALSPEFIDPREEAWQAVQNAVGNQLRGEIIELYLIQTQVRLYLIDIEQLAPMDSEQAISYAFENRLDLKNRQATVVDAFREVEVAADALESDLSLNAGIALGSDPSLNNPYRFDSSANRYLAGVQFDGPLNRLNERNFYRGRQIAYQRAAREFTASKDLVANELRSILRQLELSRLNFQIARQQVVAATRQVDEAEINLRIGGQAESVTLFLLQAQQGILDAKNSLISNWIAYRIQKMRLFAALEMLYLDERGQWLNADMDPAQLVQSMLIDAEYFPWEQTSGLWGVPTNGAAGDAANSDLESSAADNLQDTLPSLGAEPPADPAGKKPAEAVPPAEARNSAPGRPGVVIPSVPIRFEFGER